MPKFKSDFLSSFKQCDLSKVEANNFNLIGQTVWLCIGHKQQYRQMDLLHFLRITIFTKEMKLKESDESGQYLLTLLFPFPWKFGCHKEPIFLHNPLSLRTHVHQLFLLNIKKGDIKWSYAIFWSTTRNRWQKYVKSKVVKRTLVYLCFSDY